MMRCKFKVDSIERTLGSAPMRDSEGRPVKDEKTGYPKYEPCEMWTVKMSPVYGNADPDHENSKFWAASPSGAFALNTVNKHAVDALELGKEYYLDLRPAG